MMSVPVRELKQRARELVRRVEQGETIELTDSGRTVAVLSPPPGRTLNQLRALAEIDPATSDLDDLPEPLVLVPVGGSPSEVLRRRRRSER